MNHPAAGAANSAAPKPAAVGGRKQAPKRRVLTSLTTQIFIYFGGWWDAFYYVLNILVFVYKGVNLPYPNRNFAMEFCFAWLWLLIEAPRLFLAQSRQLQFHMLSWQHPVGICTNRASKGNKTERAGPLIFSFILACPLLAMYVYFVGFQTYVLKIDEILNGIALAFLCIQLLFGVITCFRFVMATRFQ